MPESASSSLSKQQATNNDSLPPQDNLQRSRMLVDFKKTTTTMAVNPQPRIVIDIARNSMWDFPTEK